MLFSLSICNYCHITFKYSQTNKATIKIGSALSELFYQLVIRSIHELAASDMLTKTCFGQKVEASLSSLNACYFHDAIFDICFAVR